MIKLTRLNGDEFYLNNDLIESLEATPDTVISLTTNKKVVVREPVEEVVNLVKGFRREINTDYATNLEAAGNEQEQRNQRG